MQHTSTAVTLPGWLVPVIPVEELEVFVVGNVNLIDLPGALVIRQIFPLDQVMNVSLFIEAIIHHVKHINETKKVMKTASVCISQYWHNAHFEMKIF